MRQAFISKSLKGAAGFEKTDFKANDPPAPSITKYVCKDAPEGYNFTVIQNKSTDQKYTETMEYSKLDGLTILDAADPKKYELTAGPNETNLVIMEAGFDGFGTAGAGGH